MRSYLDLSVPFREASRGFWLFLICGFSFVAILVAIATYPFYLPLPTKQPTTQKPEGIGGGALRSGENVRTAGNSERRTYFKR